MGGWKSVKGLFWQSEEKPAGANAAEAELSDEEFAAFLANDEFGVSTPGEPVELSDDELIDVSSVPLGEGEAGAIDFQAQYDQAQIPDTDEVEQLEAFLQRLDDSLPQASKIAAAQAFLGAVGKSTGDVLQDAERKIHVVRRLLASKEQSTRQHVLAEQGAIEELQKQIDQRRQAIESANAELERFRGACVVEESRLQGARVFFGHLDQQAADQARAGR